MSEHCEYVGDAPCSEAYVYEMAWGEVSMLKLCRAHYRLLFPQHQNLAVLSKEEGTTVYQSSKSVQQGIALVYDFLATLCLFAVIVAVFVGFMLLAAAIIPGRAHAWCYTVPAQSEQGAQVEAIRKALKEKQAQVRVRCRNRGPTSWQCESNEGDCDNREQLYYFLNQGGPLGNHPSEGWVTEYPSGQRLYCDPAFGCREY